MILRALFSRLLSAQTLVLGLSFAAGAEDSPRWRGRDANGIVKETGWLSAWPATGPKILWKASLGTGFSTITVSGGRAFSMGNKSNAERVEADFVYCFDAEKGDLIWEKSYPEPLDPKNFEGGPGASPTVDDGRVFTFSRSGKLFCFDVAKGTVIWSNDLPKTTGATKPEWGCASSPFVAGDLVIVNIGRAGTAVNKATGQVVWTTGREKAGYSSAVPFEQGGQPAVLLLGEADLFAVRIADGRILWNFPRKTFRGMNIADPVVVSPTEVFLASGYNYGSELIRIVDGKAVGVWKSANMRNHFNSSVLWQGFVFGFDESTFCCLEVKTGEVKWSERSLGKGSVVLADGKLMALSERGELVLAEATPDGFKPISRAHILSNKCWTTPVLANGCVYARNAGGSAVCLDLRGR